MSDTRTPGLAEFMRIMGSPQARTVGFPVRNCDECGAPAAVAWPINIPALEQHGRRCLSVAFFCGAHSEKLHGMLQAANPPS